MISRRSLHYFAFPIRIGLQLHCIPYRWNWAGSKKGDHLELVYSRLWLWHCIAYLNIAFRVVVISSIILVTAGSNFDPITNILSLFFVSVYTYSIGMQSLLLINYQNIHTFINNLLVLNRQLLRLHETPSDFVDGAEGILKAMKTGVITALFLNFPGGVLLINKGAGVFRFIRSSYLPVNILTALLWTFLQATDWTVIHFYLYLSSIYVNSAQNSVTRLVWRSELDEKTRATFRMMYRTHQILHSTALEFLSAVMLLWVSAGGTLMVTSFYSVIKFSFDRPNIPIMLRVGMTGVLGLLITGVYLVRARKIREYSENYPRSFLLNDANTQKYDRQFLKSCRPLKFQTCFLLFCSRDFLLSFLEGFVVSNTINLLLTFK